MMFLLVVVVVVCTVSSIVNRFNLALFEHWMFATGFALYTRLS